MRRFVIALFALMLVLAACGDDDATDTTAAAAETTMAMDMEDGEEHSEEEAHEEGDEHSEEEEAHDEESHEEETHEEGDEHSEGEHAADDDHAARVAQAEELGIELTHEYYPEAEGEVTSEYTIVMTDFAFDSEGYDLTPGETVRFILHNEGTQIHELRLSTAHLAEEHIAAGHDHSGEAPGDHHDDVEIVVNVFPGEMRTIEMTLPSDPAAIDEVQCLYPAHYEAGMKAPVEF
jgi:uncharacterized cupredoxin-like copper-binding protein